MISALMARTLPLLRSSDGTPDLTVLRGAGERALGVDCLAVSVLDSAGERELLWCSDDVARTFDDVEFTLGEGPGHDVVTSGMSVLVPDVALIDTDRWPGLTVELGPLPVRAIFCFPLAVGAIQVGALTTLRRTRGPLTGAQADDAFVLASALTALFLDGPDDDPRTPTVPALLRAAVHQATGMVSVQLEVPLSVALVRLRAYAYASGRPIADVSRDILDRVLRLGDNGRELPTGGEED
ncbi:GAF domain-containing protein [Kitasatospora indigofera]|uniref:GAF domain-containing protein n=1 Tax=Kitasatospora indigofera TaxID=67307 RepID=A0A919L3G0_9ACTN|nr:GAF and ANTAR domain-containing protein [Kitasatospora indigofera]GHH82014.1 GAF domain-containing protein [Kitasatospora indigofera]